MVSGAKIKSKREELGFTQEELAGRVLIGRSAIAQYEIGIKQPSASVLKQLADVFGVPMESLMTEVSA